MRWLAPLVLALAGCGGSAPSGPAWPKSAGTVTPTDSEDDGGESLAPRSTTPAARAIEIKADPTVAVAPVEEAPDDAPPPSTTPAEPEPTGETMEIEVEEITITPVDDDGDQEP